jgi:hypothetical protein
MKKKTVQIDFSKEILVWILKGFKHLFYCSYQPRNSTIHDFVIKIKAYPVLIQQLTARVNSTRLRLGG